jgi:hypothetical protein
MIRSAIVAVLLGMSLAGLSPAAEPAGAQPEPAPCPRCGNVALAPDGLLASAESQMATLNSGEDNPQPCTVDSEPYLGKTGYIRWRLTATEQETWDIIYNGDETTTWYRKECYFPDVDAVYGYLYDVVEFDSISPTTVAQVAVDRALRLIPDLQISTNPDPEDESLVGIDTWFWVEGVPENGVTAEAHVPGINVVATATPGAVRINFGDGTSDECTGAGVEYSAGATSDCTHEYQVADEYTVTATVLWTGTYTVNGQGPFPITTAVPRTDTFYLPVNEAQAINTGSG